MPKYLQVTMPDGSVWEIPAGPIAELRARRVAASRTTNPESPAYQTVFATEVQRALTDDALLDAWASTQLTWQDVGFLAYKVKDPPINYPEGWVNGDKRVVEHE